MFLIEKILNIWYNAGMIIESISLKSKRNPNIFNVETSVGVFEMHSDIIVKNVIRLGEIDDENFYKSVQESSEIIAFNLCVKYISSRLKTEKQIKDYLYKHEYKKNTVDAVLEKLKNYGIVDDKIYAESYIKSNSNFSKNKVKQKLMQAGVKNENFDEQISEIDELESCIKHTEKFFKNKEINKQNLDKFLRRLSGMGYGWDTIKSVLNQMKIDTEEEM